MRLSVTAVRVARTGVRLAGSFSRTQRFVSRNLWIGPVLALLALIFAGFWLRSWIEQAAEEQLGSELKALLNADTTAMQLWMEAQKGNASSIAQTSPVQESVTELLTAAKNEEADPATLLRTPAQAKLRSILTPWLKLHGYTGYVVIDPKHMILASNTEALVGERSLPGYVDFADVSLQGVATVSRPFPSLALIEDDLGRKAAGLPTMFAAAPVRDDDGKPIAVLALRARPEREFTRILNVARFGETGETYAFDDQGMLLSQSRFDNSLKEIGLIPDTDDARSVLTLELKDPGVNMTEGHRPSVRRSEQPLTRMAAQAIKTKTEGVDAIGYRDYRGVPVVGAWTWLPEYDFGVAVEIDRAEAYRTLSILQTVFWSLFGLLALAAGGLVFMTLFTTRLERQAREAVLDAKQLGQYSLEEKIGEGGMGVVYRGKHALLRRSTAIKLLDPGKSGDSAVARFEREVQLTSELAHPNTIAIYDYGRTNEGIFYYAMEFLDGLVLEDLVTRFGPQPDARVIQILVQVCGSLNEAHIKGLIHRDIKPANIMLTRRGEVPDFVKLLDFGLVKAVDNEREKALTAAASLTGTPLYLSPEAIQDPDLVDARSDLYAVGAVGYFLLTGRPVFDGKSIVDILRQHVDATPTLPSQGSALAISPDLEKILMACLAKRPDDRPQSARQMAEQLFRCQPASPWSTAMAEQWWANLKPTAKSPPHQPGTADVGPERTVVWDTSQGGSPPP